MLHPSPLCQQLPLGITWLGGAQMNFAICLINKNNRQVRPTQTLEMGAEQSAWEFQLPRNLKPDLKEGARACACCKGPHPFGPVDALFHEEGARSWPGRGRDSCCLEIRVVLLTLVFSSSRERNNVHTLK